MFKVIIAGGREFNDYQLLKKYCDYMLQNKSDVEIVCGMAKGADLLGRQYAIERGHKWKEFSADWNNLDAPNAIIKTNRFGKEYNVRAGYDRNKKMAEYGNALIAFWDGKSKGTKDMIDLAKKHGLYIRIKIYSVT